MYKKYNLPLNVFLILENTKPLIFSSKLNIPNHYILFISQTWIFLFNQILKNEFFLKNSYLVDISCIDTLKYNNLNENVSFFFKKNRILIFYIYYFYYLKLRLTTISAYNFSNKNDLISIDNIYKNAAWLEREASEMFNINIKFKKDARKLLLDYSKFEAPLLKNFNSDGLSDVFYNFFEEQVFFTNNEVVEL